jgi:hypothetical protein
MVLQGKIMLDESSSTYSETLCLNGMNFFWVMEELMIEAVLDRAVAKNRLANLFFNFAYIMVWNCLSNC